ncbi:hemolymph lipopolysaccharide-binding protein-like [Ptiloglossa arizonensis]|uniref:hemolymph lipopolysaccharide-binding protein-like n=1 Tax=Ptiloglossa arizonensis TaxID=3350558 RepID=UPI003FA04B62
MYKQSLLLLSLFNGVFCGTISYKNESTTEGPAQTIIHMLSTCNGCRNCMSVLGRSDYTITPNIGAHKLHLEGKKWNNARKMCMQEGGYLAILNSLDEEKVLLKQMGMVNVGEVWLGVHDRFEEGDWVTLTGESLESAGYNKWTNTLLMTHRRNFLGLEDCATLLNSGGMNDRLCIQHKPFFCEMDLC